MTIILITMNMMYLLWRCRLLNGDLLYGVMTTTCLPSKRRDVDIDFSNFDFMEELIALSLLLFPSYFNGVSGIVELYKKISTKVVK